MLTIPTVDYTYTFYTFTGAKKGLNFVWYLRGNIRNALSLILQG